ncbi:MAG: PEGA domain-containing protein, partial [Fibrobacter sp.]|nr:PEGA domain-containing protein [Fibrobacter sp.]
MKKLCIFTLMVAFLFASAIADDDPPPRNKPATVTIITNPPNSDVYLGNELLGKSPIENKQVMSGRQTLIVIDQGYELVNQRVNVWPGNDKRNTFDYGTKIPKGNIEVTTKPGKCI